MRRLTLIIIFYAFVIENLFGQCKNCEYKTDEIWISIDNNLDFLQNKVLMRTNDSIINYAFGKHNVNQIELVFPYSKIDRLKKLYKIRFRGKIDFLISDLQKSKKITRIIKRPKENHVELYDPSDGMWYTPTLEDPNGWLWHLKRIQAGQAWDITKGDAKIKIASIDTWFDVNHPDLTNKISPKYDPYDNTSYNSSCLPNYHGTVAASFIAAETDGGGPLASIGFKCMLICYQAWDGSYIERAQHASLAMHADVITSSAGGWTCTDMIDEDEKIALKEILDNGTIVVMPAGNGPTGTNCNYGGRDHPFKPLSPDYDERVIIVSSTGIDDKHYYFNPNRVINGVPTPREETHSHYPEVDICAPGYNTMGATCTQKYDSASGSCVPKVQPPDWIYSGQCTGTSFATPIVAGVCGLMKSVNPSLSPSVAQSIIKSTADPIVDASSYPGLVGAGRINAYKAVLAAKNACGGINQTVENLTGSLTQSKTYTACQINLNNVTVSSGINIICDTQMNLNITGTFSTSTNSTIEFK